jgi:hypothetical protein
VANLFTQEWADAVREAVNAPPEPAYRDTKLHFYWDWIGEARRTFDGTLVLGDRDLGRYAALRFADGICTDVPITDAIPDDATFALVGGTGDWDAITQGYDTSKAVMYRKLALVSGDVFAFFDRVYFFTEALASIGRIPVSS